MDWSPPSWKWRSSASGSHEPPVIFDPWSPGAPEPPWPGGLDVLGKCHQSGFVVGLVGSGGRMKVYRPMAVPAWRSCDIVTLSFSVVAALSSSAAWKPCTIAWATDSARIAALVASIDSVPDWSAGGKSARMPSTPRTMTMSAIRISISVIPRSEARFRMDNPPSTGRLVVFIDEEAPPDLAARAVDIQAHHERLVLHPQDDVPDRLGRRAVHDLVERRGLHLRVAGAEAAVARRG